MMTRSVPLLLGIVVGCISGAILWCLLNLVAVLVSDHDKVQQLWDLELRRAQAMQQVAPAAPAPPAPAP